METPKQFDEKQLDDAPLGLDNSESAFWAQGYNTALEETNAKELLEALIRLKEMAWSDGVDSLEVYEICKSAINKATK